MNRQRDGVRRAALAAILLASLAGAARAAGEAGPGAAEAGDPAGGVSVEADGYHVRPGGDIQVALDRAAIDPRRKHVFVHAGTYRPAAPAEAMIRFNRQHDLIVLEAIGDVLLTAANPDAANPDHRSFPAVVHHVVYFGDGISRKTTLRGFRITGARDFHSDSGGELPSIEPALDTIPQLRDHMFVHSDGGAIKVFGRSYPTLERLQIFGNYSDPCGAGISVEHRGFLEDAVHIRDSVFRDNQAAETGAAIDLLPRSAALIENCLFVGNVSNAGPLAGLPVAGAAFSTNFNRVHGSGALTVFPGSRAEVRRCTFTGNWNGVDDRGLGSVYEKCIFWQNTATGGIAPGGRYELDIIDGRRVTGNYFRGATDDLSHSIDPGSNVLRAPDPQFDEAFRPRAAAYADVGYRPPEDP